MKAFLAASLFTLFSVAPTSAQFMDVNSLVAGIGGIDFLKAVERIDSAPDVRVVRLSTLAGAEAAQDRLEEAVAGKPRDINYLRGSILLNPIAVSAIRNEGVHIDQIVTLLVSNDGAAVLFADDL